MVINRGKLADVVTHLCEAKADGKPYTVLLGSGMSADAGIPIGEGMVRKIALAHYQEANKTEEKPEFDDLVQWVKNQDFYARELKHWQDPSLPRGVDEGYVLYSACMAELSVSRRQKYLQGLCGKTKPQTDPYVCLAKLAKDDYVGHVLTTNFDRLAMEEIGGLTNRPNEVDTVGALPGSITNAPTRHVVYLHGRATNYDTCHSAPDVAKLPSEYLTALQELLGTTGLIVLGYRGADPDVMNALFDLLGKHKPPLPVYWLAHEADENDLSPGACELLESCSETRLVLDQDAGKCLSYICGPEGLKIGTPDDFRAEANERYQKERPSTTRQTYEAPPSDSPTASAVPKKLPWAREEDEAAPSVIQPLTHHSEPFVALPQSHETGELLVQALDCLAAGNLSEASDRCREATVMEPGYAFAYWLWGGVYMQMAETDLPDGEPQAKLYQEAATQHGRATELAPSFHEAWNDLGVMHTRLGMLSVEADRDQVSRHFDDAGKALRKGLRVAEDSASIWNNLGILSVRTAGLLREDSKKTESALINAIGQFSRALRLDLEYGGAAVNLAIVHVQRAELIREEKPAEAVGYLRRAIVCFQRGWTLLPERPDALRNCGLALWTLSQLMTPTDTVAAAYYASRACDRYDRFLKVAPDAPHEKASTLTDWGNALVQLARLDTDLQDAEPRYAQAFEKYADAAATDPDHKHAWSNWGLALAELAMRPAMDSTRAQALHEEAEKKLAEAARIAPDFAEMLANRTLNWIGLARYAPLSEKPSLLKLAEEAAVEADRLKPGIVTYNWACVYALQNRAEEALSKLRKGLQSGRAQWATAAADRDWDDLRDHPEYAKLEADFGGEE